jgi:asparagine synthase (glutamine-hydrolysing)
VDAPAAEETRAFAALDLALETTIGPWRTSPSPLTLLFSGGVDSGLLAWELRTNSSLELLTVGVAGASDLETARTGAARLGLSVRAVEIDLPEVRAADQRWAAGVEGLSPVHRAVVTAFAVALDHTVPGTVLCGQGADELFLGYAHFRGLDEREAAARSAADLERLVREDGPRAESIARQLGRRLASPYLDPEFLRVARAIPVHLRMPLEAPKGLFRRWAIHRGLPPEVAERPKRAMQYGSGVARLLARAEPRPRTADGRPR